MEILNQVTLAGNLTDKPSVDDAGGRVFASHFHYAWFNQGGAGTFGVDTLATSSGNSPGTYASQLALLALSRL